MANYSITINSKFKPFSFERYIQPYVMYGDYFSKLEDTLAAYETEADKVKTLANQASDPESYAKYQAYSNYLTDQMNDLYENGATVLNRQGLLNAKRRYNSDIAPIINAANYRREMRTKQRELRDKDPNLRFDNDFENVSIDDLVNNPDMGYRSISGGDVANMAATYAGNVAKGLMEDPEYSEILNGAFFREKLQQGFDVDQVFAEALGQSGKKLTEKDIKNINMLRNMRESIHSMYANNPAYNKDWANPYISFGFTGGIGTTAFEKFENPDYLDAGEQFDNYIKGQNLILAKNQDAREQDLHKLYMDYYKNNNGSIPPNLNGKVPTAATKDDSDSKEIKYYKGDGQGGNFTVATAYDPIVLFGHGLSTGTNNFALNRNNGAYQGQYSFGEGELYEVDHENGDNHLTREIRKIVANYFGLPATEESLRDNSNAAAKIAKMMNVYRETDRYLGLGTLLGDDNEFMITMPGVDPETGKPDKQSKAFKEFINKANEIIAAEYGS